MSIPNTFFSSASLTGQLKIARDALMAHQTSLQILGHNVANANVEGFHRQRVSLSAQYPLDGAPGQLGTGVKMDEIQRSYNWYISSQEREETGSLGRWSSEKEWLMRVESTLSEIGEYGIANALTDFWNSWEDFANDADSITSRSNVIMKADSLGQKFRNTVNGIEETRHSINLNLQAIVNNVNAIAGRLAELNKKIYTAVARGQTPNDLMDQRDQLVLELSSLVGATVEVEENGSMNVYVGHEVIVSRDNARELTWKSDTSKGKGGGDLVWADTQRELQLYTGKAYGMIQTRDEFIATAINDLDELSDKIRERVNDLHRQGIGRDGSTNNDFWRVGVSGAMSLEVNQVIRDNPEKVAASKVAPTGDNALAHEIFELQFETALQNGESSFSEFYNGIVSRIGNGVQIAEGKETTNEAALLQTKTWQEHYVGVSLDEEMANMVQLQHSFGAAARYAAAVDEMITYVLVYLR